GFHRWVPYFSGKGSRQDLIGAPGIQKGGDDRRPPRPSAPGHGQFQLHRGRGGKQRPEQGNGPGHEWGRGARTPRQDGVARRPEAGDTVTRRAEASPADGTAEVRRTDGSTPEVGGRHRDDPGMAGYDRTAERPLIPRRRHDDHPAP